MTATPPPRAHGSQCGVESVGVDEYAAFVIRDGEGEVPLGYDEADVPLPPPLTETVGVLPGVAGVVVDAGTVRPCPAATSGSVREKTMSGVEV